MKKYFDSVSGIHEMKEEAKVTLWEVMKNLHEDLLSNNRQPIRIAVIGETGVGKTSTLNALFNTKLPINHYAPCTQQAETIQTRTSKGVPLEVIDLPGLWAGEAETKRHWETYRSILPTVDSAIWVISAGDKALEGMQKSLRTIAEFSEETFLRKIVFGVNKAEHMYPEKWNNAINQPDPEQEENLRRFCVTVQNAVTEVFPDWTGEVCYYSALRQYRLNELLEQMLLAATRTDKKSVLKIVQAADTADATELIEDKRALELGRELDNRVGR